MTAAQPFVARWAGSNFRGEEGRPHPEQVTKSHPHARLSEVVDKIEREHDRVVITKRGRPAAVVLSVDDLESLEETFDVLASPGLIGQIRDSLAELEREPARTLSKDEALALTRAA